MLQHAETLNRSVQVVNLDPAAEHFDYPVMAGDYRSILVYKQMFTSNFYDQFLALH